MVLLVKIRVFWLMGKLLRFCVALLHRIEYQIIFCWQQHLEILFRFHFMRAYKFCSLLNIDQITKNSGMDFWYFDIFKNMWNLSQKISSNFPLKFLFRDFWNQLSDNILHFECLFTMNVEYKIDNMICQKQKLKIAKLSNLDKNPFQNILHFLGRI